MSIVPLDMVYKATSKMMPPDGHISDELERPTEAIAC